MARDRLDRDGIRTCSKRERSGQTLPCAARFLFRKSLAAKVAPPAPYTFRHPAVAAQARHRFFPERSQSALYVRRDKTATARDASRAFVQPARRLRRMQLQ